MPSHDAIRVVIIGAGARGNRVFADLIQRFETGFETVGVVEPHGGRRAAFQELYGIPDARAFASLEAWLAAPRFADIAFICTLDPLHFETCRQVSAHGYDVLLEKPIATTLPDCLALLEVEREARNRIFVTHVLRYTPFFQAVKRLIDSGDLGAVQHLHLAENIGHWHFAHSYVRGNWSRAADCAPMVLTKGSHDLDIVPWMVGEEVTAVSSRGGLRYFRPENAPEGATARCTACPHQEECLYSATRFYLNQETGWPFEVIADPPDTPARRRAALETGPYGVCVWRAGNDVCDEQTVTLQFASGLHAVVGLHGHTADNTRRLTLDFDRAQVHGDLRSNDLVISHFTGRRDEVHEETIALPPGGDSHGGGDLGLLRALARHLRTGEGREMVTSLRSSVLSHVLAFLAEQSRLGDGVPLPVSSVMVPPETLAPVRPTPAPSTDEPPVPAEP